MKVIKAPTPVFRGATAPKSVESTPVEHHLPQPVRKRIPLKKAAPIIATWLSLLVGTSGMAVATEKIASGFLKKSPTFMQFIKNTQKPVNK